MKGYDGHDAARALLSALTAAALATGVVMTVTDAEERPWWSATFEGARHVLTLRLDGGEAAIERLLSILPEHDFALRHHVVADIAVAGRESGTVTIEALTVAND